MKTVKAKSVHKRNMKSDEAYRAVYEALEGEFAMVDKLISACKLSVTPTTGGVQTFRS